MKNRRRKSWGSLVAALLISVTSYAQDAAPESWYQLLYNVYTKGQSTQLIESTHFYFQKGTSFDRNVDREVQYFTLATKIDFQGNMTPLSVSTVRETWKRIGLEWEVTQILRVSDTQGGLRQAYENVLTFGLGSTLKKMVQKPMPPASDAGLQAAWEKEKSEWVADFGQK